MKIIEKTHTQLSEALRIAEVVASTDKIQDAVDELNRKQIPTTGGKDSWSYWNLQSAKVRLFGGGELDANDLAKLRAAVNALSA